MSDVFYPLAGIGKLRTTPMNRVIADAFEDGSTSARYLWTSQTFKRRIELDHGPLTIAEFNTLRSFNAQRNGPYDYFWFRDNVTRGGNIKCRFAGPLPRQYEQMRRTFEIQLVEAGPIRPLAEYDEIELAAGTAASALYDPQRVVYFVHPGLSAYTEPTIHDHTRDGSWPLTFASGSNALGSILAQYQYFEIGSGYAQTASNFTAIAGTQPACTVIAFLKRASGGSGRKGIVTFGATGAGNAMGIGYNAGSYEPYLGGSETWGTATQSNASGDTWRGFGITWASASNAAKFYVNAALVGTETETRNFTAGPLVLNAEPDGTDGDTVHKIGAVLVFAAELTLAQVKAVHNLFCPHYGLSTVS